MSRWVLSTRIFIFFSFIFLSGCVYSPSQKNVSLRSFVENTHIQLEKCGVGTDELNALLNLTYRDFDQAFDGGWRAVINDKKCDERTTAELIVLYILHSRPTPLSRHNLRILRWHAGQLFADANDYDSAIRFMQGSYREGPESSLDWDLYVRGTIAFLQRDRDALIASRKQLAMREVSEEQQQSRLQFFRETFGRDPSNEFLTRPQNLNVLDGLVACFDKSYREAYGQCSKPIN